MLHRSRFFGRLTACAAFLIVGCGDVARARTYTYVYTGQDYTSYGGCLTASMNVSFKMTLSAPLPPNLQGVRAGSNVTPLSWIASNGYKTYSSKRTPLGPWSTQWDFTTDANANITSWIAGVNGQSGEVEFSASSANVNGDGDGAFQTCPGLGGEDAFGPFGGWRERK